MYERSPRANSWEAVGDPVTICLPSRLSRVRVPSPALVYEPSLCRPITSRLGTTRRREGKQGGGFSMCKNMSSDILPRFRATSCLRELVTSCLREDATSCLPLFSPPAWFSSDEQHEGDTFLCQQTNRDRRRVKKYLPGKTTPGARRNALPSGWRKHE